VKRENYHAAAIAVLSLLAAALAVLLLIKSLNGSSIPGCGAGSGCDTVLSSRFSRIGPIPVSAAALPIFLMMAVCGFAAFTNHPRRRDFFLQLQFSLALIAAGAAFWFVSLQAVVLHHFCAWCTTTHALALLASLLIFWQWSKTDLKLNPILPALAALLLIAMIASQLLFHPRLYTITRATQPSTGPSIAPTDNQLSLYNNRITINPSDWPILGSRRAQHLVIVMFDYTCAHCRREYPLLQQAQKRYGTQIAFIAIPLPLEQSCNPLVPFIPEHINSCTYTRYALAVFLSNPARFEEYHNRLMQGEHPPSLEQTRQIAEELLTPRAFAEALANPSIEKHIKGSVEIYRELNRGPIPKLILPTALISGEIYPQDHLFDVLESYLDLKPLR